MTFDFERFIGIRNFGGRKSENARRTGAHSRRLLTDLSCSWDSLAASIFQCFLTANGSERATVLTKEISVASSVNFAFLPIEYSSIFPFICFGKQRLARVIYCRKVFHPDQKSRNYCHRIELSNFLIVCIFRAYIIIIWISIWRYRLWKIILCVKNII